MGDKTVSVSIIRSKGNREYISIKDATQSRPVGIDLNKDKAEKKIFIVYFTSIRILFNKNLWFHLNISKNENIAIIIHVEFRNVVLLGKFAREKIDNINVNVPEIRIKIFDCEEE